MPIETIDCRTIAAHVTHLYRSRAKSTPATDRLGSKSLGRESEPNDGLEARWTQTRLLIEVFAAGIWQEPPVDPVNLALSLAWFLHFAVSHLSSSFHPPLVSSHPPFSSSLRPIPLPRLSFFSLFLSSRFSRRQAPFSPSQPDPSLAHPRSLSAMHHAGAV